MGQTLSTSTSETQKAFAEASKYYVYPAAEIPLMFLSLKTALNRANEVSKSRREGTGQNTKNNPMANTLLTYFQDRKNDWNNALIGYTTSLKATKYTIFTCIAVLSPYSSSMIKFSWKTCKKCRNFKR